MYRRSTAGARYVPARSASPSSSRKRSTPYCSTVDERYRIDARRALVGSYPLPRLQQDVTPADAVVQRMEAPSRVTAWPRPTAVVAVVALCRAAWSPPGWLGPRLGGHSLALTCFDDMTTAGTLPSSRVLRRDHRRYYDPLGLPLRSGRLRLRLIRARLAADVGCADGPLVFRTPPLTRAAPPTPPGPPTRFRCKRQGCCLRRDMSGSAPGLFLCRGCRLHFMLRPASLLPAAGSRRLTGSRRPARARKSPSGPGACYPALRRLPGRDFTRWRSAAGDVVPGLDSRSGSPSLHGAPSREDTAQLQALLWTTVMVGTSKSSHVSLFSCAMSV